MRHRPARGFRLRAFVLVLAFSAGLIAPDALAAPAPAELPDEGAALVAARKFDKPVKVSGLTTEASETVANPDGTMTRTQTLRPERAKRGDKWVPVDTRLRKHSDGVIRPEAAVVDVQIAAAGQGKPLAWVAKDGVEVGLSWLEPLREPKVEGAKTTYLEVWPGIDLTVEATATGFSQLLVVKTAEAAKSEKLRKITYGSQVKGGRLSQRDGLLEVRDDKGTVRFSGDASQMWDATGRPARMGVELTDTTISVIPDQAFLASPETKFPVSIDPRYDWTGFKNHHVVLQENFPDARNYDRTDGQLSDLKAGWHSSTAYSISYIDMNTGPLAGKKIHSARFVTKVINSAKCAEAEPTALWHMGGIGPDTTWRNNAPAWISKLTTAGTAINTKNNAEFCPSDGQVEVNVTALVQTHADNAFSQVTFGLFSDSGDRNDKAWRRFDLNPVLRVIYNSPPNRARDLSMERGVYACGVGPKKAYVPTRTPRLRGLLSDPDGGVLSSHVVLHKGPRGDSFGIANYRSADTPSGSYVEVQAEPEVIAEDGVYHWLVNASDGEIESGWEDSCEFVVDTVKPVVPQASSVEYPASVSGGGVGVTGTFELDSVKSANDDVVKFVYSFTSDGGESLNREMAAGADGKATIRWTPSTATSETLFVKTVDRAGNLSDVKRYNFIVLPGGPPTAHWALDGTLTDTNGGNALTPGGNPNLAAAGYSAKAAGLNSTQNFLSGGAVVDTSKNFTLSAWAKMDNGDVSRAVMSTVDGSTLSSSLYYDQANRRWAFGMTANSNRADLKVVHSLREAEAGVWTHLAGTYEALSKTFALHVDGKKQGEVTGLEGWQASQLLVGRQRWNGQDGSGFIGSIDEIKVYNRKVNDSEVKVLAKQAAIRAHYKISEGTGTSTKDEVTGRNATVTGKVGWEKNSRYTSLLLNGPDAEGNPQDLEAYASAPAPGIRTDRPFTVSTWARLDLSEHQDRARTIVSLVHNGTSQLDIRYGGASKKWEFVMGGTTVPTDSEPDLTDPDWVHLTAVHDTTASEMRLYLNGLYITRAPFTGGSAQTESTLEFGRLTPATADGSFWKGGIDDVRVYAGVLSDEVILAQAVRS